MNNIIGDVNQKIFTARDFYFFVESLADQGLHGVVEEKAENIVLLVPARELYSVCLRYASSLRKE